MMTIENAIRKEEYGNPLLILVLLFWSFTIIIQLEIKSADVNP